MTIIRRSCRIDAMRSCRRVSFQPKRHTFSSNQKTKIFSSEQLSKTLRSRIVVYEVVYKKHPKKISKEKGSKQIFTLKTPPRTIKVSLIIPPLRRSPRHGQILSPHRRNPRRSLIMDRKQYTNVRKSIDFERVCNLYTARSDIKQK